MCELNQKSEIYFELIAKQSDNPVKEFEWTIND